MFLMSQVLASIYKNLQLSITNLIFLANISTLSLKQSMT